MKGNTRISVKSNISTILTLHDFIAYNLDKLIFNMKAYHYNSIVP